MRHNYFSLGLLALSISAFGQVGVGTTNPAATLQVTGNPTTASSADGIIAPIISRTNLMAKTGYTSTQKGVILYVDDITGTAPEVGSSTESVTSIGYYYFEGEKWIKFNNPVNMYNTDSSLTGNRIVTQGVNTLAFNSTAINGFSVDGATFSVDGANSRVGIGTIAPTNTLHIKATTNPIKVEGLQNDATVDNIVAADANGVLKTINDLPRRYVYSTNAIAPGASQTLNITAPNFVFAQINVVATNACTRTMIASFSKYGDTMNFLGAQARNIPGQATLLDANGNNISLKFPAVFSCADGGTGTQFDFDILVSGNNITITNKGNIAKSYSIRTINNL